MRMMAYERRGQRLALECRQLNRLRNRRLKSAGDYHELSCHELQDQASSSLNTNGAVWPRADELSVMPILGCKSSGAWLIRAECAPPCPGLDLLSLKVGQTVAAVRDYVLGLPNKPEFGWGI